MAGFVGFIAVAVVSLVVELTPSALPLDQVRMASTIEKAAAAPGIPVYVTAPAAEEVAWHAGGSVRLTPPWKPAPPEPFVAIADDTSTLPPTEDPGPVELAGPWVARRQGQPRANRSANPIDLMDLLPEAHVEARPSTDGAPRKCDTWRFGRWFCGPKEWNHVGPETLTIDGKPQRCLWLHPLEREALTVSWPALPVPATLKGRIALSDQAAATRQGAPVHFEVEVAGQPTIVRTHPNKRGWSSFQADLKVTGAPDAEVRITIKANNTGRRHFCLDAQLIPVKTPQERP
mgnify:CR=1 FL=1